MSARSRVGDILVRAGILDDLQLRSALSHQERWGGRLTHALLELSLAQEEDVVAALAVSLNIPRVNLGGQVKDPSALARIPVTFAEQKGVFPVTLRDQGKTLVLAMAEPTDLRVVDEAASVSRARIQPAIAGEQEIARAVSPLPERRAHRRPEESDQRRGQRHLLVLRRGRPGERVLAEALSEGAGAGGSAQSMLEEMLATSPGAGWTEEQRQRVRALVENQEKSSLIMRGLLTLLVEKGLLRPSALEAWKRGEPLPPLPQLKPPK